MSDSTGRASRTGSTRLQAFVDAAFAFAVTLLVLTSGDSIPRDAADFVAALRRIPAFAVSFALIAMFWYAHVKWSARWGGWQDDGWCTFLSFALVFTVLVFVYPLRAMAGGFVAYVTRGALPADVAITGVDGLRMLAMTYGLAYLTMSALMASLYARSARLLAGLGGEALADARSYRNVWLIQATIAALSFSFAASAVPLLVMISPWWYSLLAVLMPLYGYWERRQWAARQAAAAG